MHKRLMYVTSIRLLLPLLLAATLGIRASPAQNLTEHTLSHRGTDVSVKLTPEVQRKVREAEMMGGEIPIVTWMSNTEGCRLSAMALDVGVAFSEKVRPAQIPFKQAQQIFDGSVEKLVGLGGEKVTDEKERWGEYPSRLVTVVYGEYRKVTVVRSIMVGTVNWSFMWTLEDAGSSTNWKKEHAPLMSEFFESVGIVDDGVPSGGSH